MDIIGVTFSGEMKDYIAIKTIKISKWIDPKDLSMEVVFRLTIEHIFGQDGFKKLREFYIYFREEDLEEIILKEDTNEENGAHDLEKKISPLREPIPRIRKEKVEKDERKRIRVVLEDYNVTEETRKSNIKLLLKFKRSIDIFDNIGTSQKPLWSYNCLIGPYSVQTLRYNREEFMPPIELLEVWLQIPRNLYGSLSAVSVQPVGYFEQMFLLGIEIAERFRGAGQHLAKEDTLCINWSFPNISTSSPPEEIEVTCGMRKFGIEESFIRRIEENPENSILILREILYLCKVRTLDFNYIISRITNRKLKEILDIFNTMVFQRYLRSMKENLDHLIPLLEHFRDLPYGEEFFSRYYIFRASIYCESSKDFSSEQLFSMFRHLQELEDILEPDYIALVRDFSDFVEVAEKSRYKINVLSKIEDLDHKWSEYLIFPDRYIFFEILKNWKDIVEGEYEEMVPLPDIKAEIKTKLLAFSDEVGFVLSIRNTGVGKAEEVYARLIQTDDYDILTEKSEVKPLLTNEGEPFEPELVVRPRDDNKTTVSYEIRYRDALRREARVQFKGTIDFIRKKFPFQKIENPYIIGGIVRERKMFYGREKLIESIVDGFKGKYQTNPIFLYGQRRTGKTSILYHLKERLRDEFFPVSFDMLEIFGIKSFFKDLMEKIRDEIGFKDLKISNIENNPFKKFKDNFYSEIKQKLEGRKIVLMIDEYERIDELITNGYYDDNVIDFLNALVQDGEIKVIIAGFLQPEELQNGKWKNLMRFFTTIDVSFLNRESTVKLIRDPIRGLMEYDQGGIEKIISLSGCHPYFLQLICHTMVEYHNLTGINLIGYSDITGQIHKYLDKGENIFYNIISAQTQEIERKIVSSLCNLMEEEKSVSIHKSEILRNLISHGGVLRKDEIEKAFSHLERKEIIERSSEHPEHYEFTVDLYKHWIRWNI